LKQQGASIRTDWSVKYGVMFLLKVEVEASVKKPKLFSSLLSANGRKVQEILYELEIDVILIEVNVYYGEGNDPEYLKINPLGKIPTLVDYQIILTESNAIMIYLSEMYGVNNLYGTSPCQRAEVNKLFFGK